MSIMYLYYCYLHVKLCNFDSFSASRAYFYLTSLTIRDVLPIPHKLTCENPYKDTATPHRPEI